VYTPKRDDLGNRQRLKPMEADLTAPVQAQKGLQKRGKMLGKLRLVLKHWRKFLVGIFFRQFVKECEVLTIT
jgi:hypothetical protein